MLVKLNNDMYISAAKIRFIQRWINYNNLNGNQYQNPPPESFLGSIITYETGVQINIEGLTPTQVYEAIEGGT